MYKVVIIDDEPIIVEGISKVVPWERYGCQIVGTAENGIEGLEVIRRERPDILFSDISMPGLDGLSMIAAFRVEFPDMMISILTGFRDFDYAQTAIRLGVIRFLLKPSNMKEIEEAVAVMVENLKKLNVAHEEKAEGQETVGQQEQGHEPEKGEGKSKEDSAASSFIVKNALAYIEENYREHLTLGDVAEHTYVSQWHLSKLLNRHTGQNFSEILNTARIQHAKELLKDPSLRIGDVAEAVGFIDIAHFSRVFKKIEGISANEFRNRRL